MAHMVYTLNSELSRAILALFPYLYGWEPCRQKPFSNRIPARGASTTIDPGRPCAGGGPVAACGIGGTATSESKYRPLETLVGQSPVRFLVIYHVQVYH